MLLSPHGGEDNSTFKIWVDTDMGFHSQHTACVSYKKKIMAWCALNKCTHTCTAEVLADVEMLYCPEISPYMCLAGSPIKAVRHVFCWSSVYLWESVQWWFEFSVTYWFGAACCLYVQAFSLQSVGSFLGSKLGSELKHGQEAFQENNWQRKREEKEGKDPEEVDKSIGNQLQQLIIFKQLVIVIIEQ